MRVARPAISISVDDPSTIDTGLSLKAMFWLTIPILPIFTFPETE